MTNKTKERDFRLEFIRGISMLVIVLYHYSCALDLKGIMEPYRPLWYFKNGAWGAVFVVVFFMISGYVMMLQYHDKLEIKTFYKKRWLSLFPMFYTAWFIMYLVRTVEYKTPFWGGAPYKLIYSFVGMDGYLKNGGENYYTVGEWFLGAIIILYLLFPLLRWLYQRYKWVTTTCLCGMFLALELTHIIDLCTNANLFFSIFSFWMGMLFWEYRDKCKNFAVQVVALIVCILSCVVDLTPYISNIAVCHIFGIAAFTVLYNIPVEKVQNNRIIKNGIIFLSKYSYAVMLVHHVLVYWGIKACNIIGLNLNLGLPVIIIGIYVAAFIFDKAVKWMMTKIKVGNKIGTKQ